MVLNIFADILALLSPFIIAGAIAFIVNVPMVRIENTLFASRKTKRISKKIARPVSLLLALLFLALIIAFGLFVIVPQLSQTISTLSVKVEAFIPQLQTAVIELFQNNPEIEDFIASLDFTDFKDSFIDFLRTGALNIFDSTINMATGFVSILTTLFIAIVFALYILLQKEILSTQFCKIFFALLKKQKAENIIRIFSLMQKTFSRFISGQCLEAVILGGLFVIILPIFRIPFSLLLGVVIGFSSIIPILGAFFGAGVGAFLLFIENPMQAVYFLIIFIVIQQIEGNLIYPKVVGDSVGLPAMWVLAAISIGGGMMGVFGILLFIPLTSVAYALCKEHVQKKLQEKAISLDDIRKE